MFGKSVSCILVNFLSITIKTEKEIQTLRDGGKRLSEILAEVVKAARPGTSFRDLDELAENLILKSGGLPSFKDYKSSGSSRVFPASLCVSVNDEVVHGLPGGRKIKLGDVLKLDLGLRYPPDGLFTDLAVTLTFGEVPEEVRKLVRVTREATLLGIAKAKAGNRIGDISSAIQEHLWANKIGIVRDLAGHGVGYAVHEDPLIPNYGRPGAGEELQQNMVLAIEVMTTLGSGDIKLAEDGWTFRSQDGTTGAHFEHTVVVTFNEPEIITKWP